MTEKIINEAMKVMEPIAVELATVKADNAELVRLLVITEQTRDAAQAERDDARTAASNEASQRDELDALLSEAQAENAKLRAALMSLRAEPMDGEPGCWAITCIEDSNAIIDEALSPAPAKPQPAPTQLWAVIEHDGSVADSLGDGYLVSMDKVYAEAMCDPGSQTVMCFEPVAPATTSIPEHCCGAAGFGREGPGEPPDVCPGCEFWKAQRKQEEESGA